MLDGKTVGYRHDVWGLGVLFYYLVAGQLPFQGENEVETAELIRNESPDFQSLKYRKVSQKIIQQNAL